MAYEKIKSVAEDAALFIQVATASCVIFLVGALGLEWVYFTWVHPIVEVHRIRNQENNKNVAKEENNKREPTQAPRVQEKQTLSESVQGFYAVVTRSVEIHQNGQITHEVDLDKDGDSVTDYRVKFDKATSLSKGDKVSIVSLMKHPSFKLFKVLPPQKENF